MRGGRYLPKSVVCIRERYSRARIGSEVLAGLTVGVVALPLAMAFGIASIPESVSAELAALHPGLTPPAIGLFTAIVGGLIISALGGSRVQIGGPTGAFVVIVYGICAEHGFAGLTTATAMAGVILALMGLCRFGGMIKFIPYPVTTGFTSGIAVIIAAGQIKDIGGLGITDLSGAAAELPAAFVPKLQSLVTAAHTVDWVTLVVGGCSLAVLVLTRRFTPRIPGPIVAVVLGAAAVWVLGLDAAHGGPVATIGSRFGGIPGTLPRPHLPAFSPELIRELIPAATTIAVLGAIESLLSAVVADGLTGFRHKADCELVAQGAANIACSLFWGIPATGAIARTVTNIRAGGRTPLAGIVHALGLVVIMLVAAPLAGRIPLASLSAVLLMVAWNMSEIDHFRSLLKAPRSDVLVLLTTFGLTVLTDLTVAVGVGMVLAAMLFMKRMADVANIDVITREFGEDEDELPERRDPNAINRRHVPEGVEVYEINGPLFFGVADRLKDTLSGLERPPAVFILRMRHVPVIDASGLHALGEFHAKCARQGTALLLSGVHAQPLFAMTKAGLDRVIGVGNMFGNIDDSLNHARGLVGRPAERPPEGAFSEVAREQHPG